jgi:uncharacterized membrane protein
MKYFSIVVLISLFVVVYVWQNIEMMKIKMDYKRLMKTEKEVIQVNDRLRFECGKLKSFRFIEADAAKNNLRHITPADLITIKIDETDKNGKK